MTCTACVFAERVLKSEIHDMSFECMNVAVLLHFSALLRAQFEVKRARGSESGI